MATAAQIVAALAPIVGKAGAAGAAGNLMQESSDRSNAPGGSLAQWQGPRYTAYVNYAKAHNLATTSDAAALGYLRQDLSTTYAGLAKTLRATKDPGEAALLFSQQYERPEIPMNQNRINYAKAAYNAPGAASLAPGQPLATGQRSTTQTNSTGGGINTEALAEAVLAKEAARPIGAKISTANPLNDYVDAEDSGLYNTPVTQTKTIITAAPTVQTRATVLKSPVLAKGVVQYDDKPVAAWIEPVLQYAKSKGWTGTVSSGYRTLAQQTAIYDSGVRPAAKPGTSNHEMTAFPGGAVDVTQAQQLSNILSQSKYKDLLVWAGAKDPVHFSHPHNGSY